MNMTDENIVTTGGSVLFSLDSTLNHHLAFIALNQLLGNTPSLKDEELGNIIGSKKTIAQPLLKFNLSSEE